MDEYPSSSEAWYPEPPKQQQEAAQIEQTKTISSLPVVQEVLDWFDEQIAIFSHPTVISGVTISTPADDVKSAVLLSQGQRASFEKKKKEFMNRFRQYLESADEA